MKRKCSDTCFVIKKVNVSELEAKTWTYCLLPSGFVTSHPSKSTSKGSKRQYCFLPSGKHDKPDLLPFAIVFHRILLFIISRNAVRPVNADVYETSYFIQLSIVFSTTVGKLFIAQALLANLSMAIALKIFWNHVAYKRNSNFRILSFRLEDLTRLLCYARGKKLLDRMTLSDCR